MHCPLQESSIGNGLRPGDEDGIRKRVSSRLCCTELSQEHYHAACYSCRAALQARRTWRSHGGSLIEWSKSSRRAALRAAGTFASGEACPCAKPGVLSSVWQRSSSAAGGGGGGFDEF